MTLKEKRIALLTDFGEKLATLGFKKQANLYSYYRNIEGGWVAIHLSFIHHYDDFDITISVSVRFDLIEDFVHSNNTQLSKKEKKQTSTFGVELGNLSIGQQKRWTVNTETQITSVTDSILSTYKEFGEPYLSQHANLKSAYKLLCRDDSGVWSQCPVHGVRAKKAVALAKILGKDDIQSLISRKRKVLEDMNDFGLPDFLKFIKSLSE